MLQNEVQKSRASNRVTLVLGGVRSGKSRFAQTLADRAHRVTFVATAQARADDEMRAKILRHQRDRPDHWPTVEEPLLLGTALEAAGVGQDVVLVDCLTLFAANLLEEYGEQTTADHPRVVELCAALKAPPCAVVLVSNEVGWGVVPSYPLGRRFRDLAGEINQRVAAVADDVFLLVAGLPLVLKGELPR